MDRAKSISPAPQFVIKVSKYCNLRCDYCYEFPHLANKDRMSLANIRSMFTNIANSVENLETEQAEFIWHGGEPFLIPIEFYEQVDTIQKQIFGGFLYTNIVQTNLTVLTDRHIEFLKGGFFADVGVSFDVYGDQRIDADGNLRTETVLTNLQKLIDNKIHFGAIAVLARNTLPHVTEIYRFFDDLGVSHRLLEFYRTAGEGQAERHAIDFDELVGAYKDLFREWLASESASPVQPIEYYIRYVASYVAAQTGNRYDRSANERVFMIDVNGDLYNAVESYQPEFRYGNLFRSPLWEIVASEQRRLSIALSHERMQRYCDHCPYFGHCPGKFVADATPEQRKLLEARGCPVRAILDHIVDVFEANDINDFIVKTHSLTAVQEHPAISVN
jgi:uncharacterized protein